MNVNFPPSLRDFPFPPLEVLFPEVCVLSFTVNLKSILIFILILFAGDWIKIETSPWKICKPGTQTKIFLNFIEFFRSRARRGRTALDRSWKRGEGFGGWKWVWRSLICYSFWSVPLVKLEIFFNFLGQQLENQVLEKHENSIFWELNSFSQRLLVSKTNFRLYSLNSPSTPSIFRSKTPELLNFYVCFFICVSPTFLDTICQTFSEPTTYWISNILPSHPSDWTSKFPPNVPRKIRQERMNKNKCLL
jgi:hypothetical protein